jgi:hypothetical protein
MKAYHNIGGVALPFFLQVCFCVMGDLIYAHLSVF